MDKLRLNILYGCKTVRPEQMGSMLVADNVIKGNGKGQNKSRLERAVRWLLIKVIELTS